MKSSQLLIAVFLAVATLMSGCTNPDYHPVSSSPSYSGNLDGVIDTVEVTSGDSGRTAGIGIGAGTVIGGVVGGGSRDRKAQSTATRSLSYTGAT